MSEPGSHTKRRPAAVDALDEDQIRVGIPACVDDGGDAAFKARYFFAELVRRTHGALIARAPDSRLTVLFADVSCF